MALIGVKLIHRGHIKAKIGSSYKKDQNRSNLEFDIFECYFRIQREKVFNKTIDKTCNCYINGPSLIFDFFVNPFLALALKFDTRECDIQNEWKKVR